MEYQVVNDFEILKSMDTEDIYNKTYITLENIEAIKSKNFAVFTRFKLNGFIDILSKRLFLDLRDFKKEANSYFDLLEPVEEVSENEVKTSKPLPLNIEKIDKKKLFYGGAILFGLSLFGILFIFINQQTNNPLEDVKVSPPSDITNNPIKQVLPTIETNQSDVNISIKEINNTSIDTDVSKNIQNREKIEIIPHKKIWIGVINLDTKEKKGEFINSSFSLDSSKNQIIVINGAYLTLMVGDKEKKYNYEGRVRFMCKDGKIEEISYTHFKSLNNGKGWD